MERDFFGDLPSEITTTILSRLPIRILAISKSVCKPWLNLIDSDDFHKSEIKTPPALALLTPNVMRDSTQCTIFEIEDEDEANAEKSGDLHYIPLMDFEFPHQNLGFMDCISAGGLLLWYSLSTKGIPLYICNPITREYAELCWPEEYNKDHVFRFGFGVSKISGQYKVVGVNTFPESIASHHLYTLGTGTWRRVEAGAASSFMFRGPSIECNGNLHGIVFDLSYYMWICGFDVETECFRVFSLPPGEYRDVDWDLSVLRDCMCYSYTHDNEFVIWMMKEYQVEDSWTIEYKMNAFYIGYRCVHPIKHFKDGDILMLVSETGLIFYYNKTRTFEGAGDAGYHNYLIFTPSFFSLKNFGFENVISSQFIILVHICVFACKVSLCFSFWVLRFLCHLLFGFFLQWKQHYI